MKKKNIKKLSLRSETIRSLDSIELTKVGKGAVANDGNRNGCGWPWSTYLIEASMDCD